MPKGFYERSPELKELLRQRFEKFRVRPGWNKGKKMNYSDAAKARMVRLGYKHTEEAKKKISKSLLGRKRPHTSEKLREGTLRRYAEGKPMGFKRGPAHPYWRGGVTPLLKSIRMCQPYKEWHRLCLARDRYSCVICSVNGCALEVDHYPVQFAQIIKHNNIDTLEEAISCSELWNPSNGRTLCKPCHKKYGKQARASQL